MISGKEITVTVILTIFAAYFWFKSVMTIRKKLIDAKAVSPERALKLDEAGIPWWCGLQLELVAEKTEDGRYYLPVDKQPLRSAIKGAVHFFKSGSGMAATLGISLVLTSTLTPVQTIPIIKEIIFFTGLAILIYGLTLFPNKK